jgi:predicted nucleic acid-binding protein
MLLTLDSSVIVAALRSQEPWYQECRRILDQLHQGHHLAVEPFTVLIEVTAAIRRRTNSAALANRVYRDLRSLNSLQFVEIDAPRSEQAAFVAQHLSLRGMDAIVVAIAHEFSSSLVSLDDEILTRVQGFVPIAMVSQF